MTLLDAVDHICAVDACDVSVARLALIKALADGALKPVRWDVEAGDRRPPGPIGSMLIPDDVPPSGKEWLTAAIDWSTGRVRDDLGEYNPGKARAVLLLRQRLVALWPMPDCRATPTTGQTKRKRGPKPIVLPRVIEDMRRALRSGEFSADSLRGLKEVELEVRFGASRDTCRKALASVLSEPVGN